MNKRNMKDAYRNPHCITNIVDKTSKSLLELHVGGEALDRSASRDKLRFDTGLIINWLSPWITRSRMGGWFAAAKGDERFDLYNTSRGQCFETFGINSVQTTQNSGFYRRKRFFSVRKFSMNKCITLFLLLNFN